MKKYFNPLFYAAHYTQTRFACLKRYKYWLPVSVCIILLPPANSCRKQAPPVIVPTTKGIYITNEGNYGFGNAEVSFYNPVTQVVTNNIFYGANNYHLGDVAQSMYIIDSTGYIVVNNSQRIVAVKIPSFKTIFIINTPPNSSPRYFLPVSDSLAYVTDLYAGQVHVVNYKSGVLVKEISQVASWTEHLVAENGEVVVEERSPFDTLSTGTINTINTNTNSFIHRYSFPGSNVDGMVKDQLNRVWFGMDPDSAQSIPAAIYCLNSDMSLNKIIKFGAGHSPSHLCINGGGNEIYYFDSDGIDRISINDSLPPSNFIPVNGRNLYGLGVDPSNNDIYASDALDYVQPSRIYRYDVNGNLVQSFTAGIISGNFAFNDQ